MPVVASQALRERSVSEEMPEETIRIAEAADQVAVATMVAEEEVLAIAAAVVVVADHHIQAVLLQAALRMASEAETDRFLFTIKTFQ